MRLGLVGYGAGGRYFHAPFIAAADGVELVGVVTRSPYRRAELAADHPGVPVFDSLSTLLAAGVDAVTITTPPQTRRELVLEAVAAGVHVIADKPFAPTADDGRLLVDAAAKASVVLNVFHNRRWDADIRTLAAVLARGDLGKLWRVESRFDADDPATLEAGPQGGLLRDIGSHLVDQMLWLLGPAQRVTAELEWVDLSEGRTDCGFGVVITHVSGVHSRVSSTKLNRIDERELRAYGSAGGYVARGTDVQAQAIFAGCVRSTSARHGVMTPSPAMDPSKVDGLARVLSDIARTRQVIVFSHDDRLADAVRRLPDPATILAVHRGERSVVQIVPAYDPVRRYIDDARVIVRTRYFPEDLRGELGATLLPQCAGSRRACQGAGRATRPW